MGRRKHKGSSKAGRPRKAGDRYPSGKLKPLGPNETTLAKRQAGDASAGEHPLDFALSKGWLTEQQHRDATAYRAAFNGAHRGAGGPRLALNNLSEVEPSEALRTGWSEMPSAEISRIFDRVFSGVILPQNVEARQAKAAERWRKMNEGIPSPVRGELFQVCVLASWPFWMTKKAAGRPLGAQDLAKEGALRFGLDAVADALRPPKPAQASTIRELPVQPKGRAKRSEQDVHYVSEEGEAITTMSERGVPFEVSILRRRA